MNGAQSRSRAPCRQASGINHPPASLHPPTRRRRRRRRRQHHGKLFDNQVIAAMSFLPLPKAHHPLLPLGKVSAARSWSHADACRTRRQVRGFTDLDHHEQSKGICGQADWFRRLRQYVQSNDVRESRRITIIRYGPRGCPGDVSADSCENWYTVGSTDNRSDPQEGETRMSKILLNGNNICMMVPGGDGKWVDE
ncbi:LSM domain-containing protein [Paraphaeosphaeria minitans]|uniref:LSM domain-containing protein n=1 Tax=Paraphaeosphaeria minitans TaxID=565426 RepID=A0A9P6G7Q7_9PLEO|nr:LSM domain-containing protein [Paraphaeosphaeria minitans]